MKEYTFEEFCALQLEYTFGMCFDWGAHRMYRQNDIGMQKEVVTKRNRKNDIYSGWKDGEVYFYLDGDENTYRTADQVYVAYMEKACRLQLVKS